MKDETLALAIQFLAVLRFYPQSAEEAEQVMTTIAAEFVRRKQVERP